MPLTLIIDRESASAAEIFSGAIRDHHRGTVVGERSFGKGSVQGIFQLEGSDAGLRLTTAKFYSPTGKPYSRVGVEPDVVVHQAARPINGALAMKDDAMLTAALQDRAEGCAAEVTAIPIITGVENGPSLWDDVRTVFSSNPRLPPT